MWEELRDTEARLGRLLLDDREEPAVRDEAISTLAARNAELQRELARRVPAFRRQDEMGRLGPDDLARAASHPARPSWTSSAMRTSWPAPRPRLAMPRSCSRRAGSRFARSWVRPPRSTTPSSKWRDAVTDWDPNKTIEQRSELEAVSDDGGAETAAARVGADRGPPADRYDAALPGARRRPGGPSLRRPPRAEGSDRPGGRVRHRPRTARPVPPGEPGAAGAPGARAGPLPRAGGRGVRPAGTSPSRGASRACASRSGSPQRGPRSRSSSGRPPPGHSAGRSPGPVTRSSRRTPSTGEELRAAEEERRLAFVRDWPPSGGLSAPRDLAPTARSPLIYTGLILAREGPAPGEGVELSGGLIAELSLGGLRSAFLPDCDTGVGEYLPAEGVQSLQEAFHLAGCPNVIASLWPVPDAPTRALVAGYYDQLWDEGRPTSTPGGAVPGPARPVPQPAQGRCPGRLRAASSRSGVTRSSGRAWSTPASAGNVPVPFPPGRTFSREALSHGLDLLPELRLDVRPGPPTPWATASRVRTARDWSRSVRRRPHPRRAPPPPVRVGATGVRSARTARAAPRGGRARSHALEGPSPSARGSEPSTVNSAVPASPAAPPAPARLHIPSAASVRVRCPHLPPRGPRRAPRSPRPEGCPRRPQPTGRRSRHPPPPRLREPRRVPSPSRRRPPGVTAPLPQASPSWVDRARPALAFLRGSPRRLALPWVVGGGILAVLVLVAVFFTEGATPQRAEPQPNRPLTRSRTEGRRPGRSTRPRPEKPVRPGGAATRPRPGSRSRTIAWRDAALPPASEDPDAPILLVQVHSLDRLFDDLKVSAKRPACRNRSNPLFGRARGQRRGGGPARDRREEALGRLRPLPTRGESVPRSSAWSRSATRTEFLKLLASLDCPADQDGTGLYVVRSRQLPGRCDSDSQTAMPTGRSATPPPWTTASGSHRGGCSPRPIDWDVVVTARADRLPAPMREAILRQIRRLGRADARQMGGASGEQQAWARKLAESASTLMRDVFEGKAELTLRLGVDPAAREFVADLHLRAAPGSLLARNLSTLAPGPSRFGGVIAGNPALALLVHVQLPDDYRRLLAETRARGDGHRSLAMRARTSGRARAARSSSSKKPWRLGELDVAMAIRSHGAGKPGCSSGLKVPDGEALDGLIPRSVREGRAPPSIGRFSSSTPMTSRTPRSIGTRRPPWPRECPASRLC